MILCEYNTDQYELAECLKEKTNLNHKNNKNKLINKICLPEYKKLFKKSIIDVINNNDIVYSECIVCKNKNVKCIRCKSGHTTCLYCLKKYILICEGCNFQLE